MKILIITQKVDINDDILGFFHRWIEEFAKYYEKVTVVCLQKREYSLPENVKVLSLGKEAEASKLKYIFNFYKYIWQERKNYDAVFIHMNQEYVLLGWKFWTLWNKKIFLWRNHAKGNLVTKLAVFFSDKVFCTSPQSFTARFKKTTLMPVGVDDSFFNPNKSVRKKPNSILFLGRIDPVKKVDVFIDVLNILKNKGVDFSATITGSASDKNKEYEKNMKNKVLSYDMGGRVTFTGSASKSEALQLYREHELYVNLTSSGSLDKTIFEALASGAKVIAINAFLKGKLPDNWVLLGPDNLESLALAVGNILTESYENGSDLKEKIYNLIKEQSLESLIKKLMASINALV